MDILYKPSKWGREYHALMHDEALGAGAAGPGKTTVLIAEPLYQIRIEHDRCENPDHKYPLEWGMSVGWALYLRRTFPMLQQTIVRANRIFKRIDPGVTFNVKESTFTFSSGFRYQFGQCQHTGDWENYYSNEYTKILFDELNAFEKEQYDQICSRCRSDDPVLEPMSNIRSMSNPVQRLEAGQKTAVSDPYWVRDYFVDPAPLGRVTLKKDLVMEDGTTEVHRRIYLPAKLWDNPNKSFVRAYEKKLRSRPAHIRKALLEGDWYSVVGGYFEDSWDPGLHVCRAFRIPDEWPQFRAMDWGYKKPGCVGYFAMDPDENLFMHREVNFKGLDARQCGLMLASVEKTMGLWDKKSSRIGGPADNQLWENRGDVGKSKAAEMQAVGISWTKADKRSRQRNAERIVNRFKDHQNRTTTPGLVVFSSCVMTIKTLPTIPTNPANPEEPQDGGQDHWLDMIGYACAHASNGRAGISMKGAIDEFEDDEAHDEQDEYRGQLGYGNELL